MLLQTALRNLGAGWWVIALMALAVVGGGEARADGDKVVATVNNEIITETDFLWRLQRMHGADFLMPTNPPSMRNENAGYIMMNSLINEKLILQLAAKSNLLPTDAEIDADLQPLLKQENVQKAIKDGEVKPDDIKYDIRLQKSRFNLAANHTTVTPAEIQEFYTKNINSYTTPERWGLAAIRTDKMEDAVKVEGELRMGKAFGEVAKVYSQDERTKNDGGNIGAFNAGDPQLPKPIRDAVKDLKIGEVTRPIESDFQTQTGVKSKVYWIVKMLIKLDVSVRPLAEVRTQVERLAILQKVGGLETADKKILDFRNSSDIKINLPGYEGLLNKPTKP